MKLITRPFYLENLINVKDIPDIKIITVSGYFHVVNDIERVGDCNLFLKQGVDH